MYMYEAQTFTYTYIHTYVHSNLQVRLHHMPLGKPIQSPHSLGGSMSLNPYYMIPPDK